MKAPYNKITLSDSMEMRKLHQVHRINTKDLVKKYRKKGYNKRSIFRHMVREISDTTIDKRVFNSRPRTPRTQNGNITVT